MNFLKVIIIALALSVSGCATTGSKSPRQAAITSGQLFKFQTSHFAWIPSSSGLAGGLASAFASSAGSDSPHVEGLVRIMKPAISKVVRIGISGSNSSFTASIIVSALENSPEALPMLQLAFIGSSEDEVKVRAAVQAKKATFLFSNTKGS